MSSAILLTTAIAPFSRGAGGTDPAEWATPELGAVLIQALPHTQSGTGAWPAGAEIRVVEEAVAPGAVGPWRTFQAPATVAYVLEGRLRVQTLGGGGQILAAGEYADGEAFVQPAAPARYANPDPRWPARVLLAVVGVPADRPTFGEAGVPPPCEEDAGRADAR